MSEHRDRVGHPAVPPATPHRLNRNGEARPAALSNDSEAIGSPGRGAVEPADPVSRPAVAGGLQFTHGVPMGATRYPVLSGKAASLCGSPARAGEVIR